MGLSLINNKIAVALSGGVDSAVAAALSVQDYGPKNVFGLTLELFENKNKKKEVRRAKDICYQLGIKHYLVDGKEIFKKEIIDNLISNYQKGKTPNPCVRCNKFIKFGYLLDYATNEKQASFLVTGHYARILKDNNQFLLFRGLDLKKDQSYFLAMLSQKQLARTLLPLGEMTKEAVKKKAQDLGLPYYFQSESQDVCFVDNNFSGFMRKNLPKKPGKIVDLKGKIYGEHQGLAYYTIGQRKGLGGGFPEPFYVVKLDGKSNRLVVGKEEELYRDNLIASGINWLGNHTQMEGLSCQARIRYSTKLADCLLSHEQDGNYRVKFLTPQRAITPGQIIVFYQGEQVLGGATITE